jgi:hypothetical protein
VNFVPSLRENVDSAEHRVAVGRASATALDG